MNKLDPWYQSLLSLLMSENLSTSKSDRTGTGTRSSFGIQFKYNMKDGFPLLTTKKMAFKSIVTELLWFLKGDTNIKYLVDNDCHIWDGDAYKNYINYTQHEASYTKEQFINLIKTDKDWANVWGDLGPIYGAQWRGWDWDLNPKPIDQIANLINDLKTNPDSRRLIVNAWNVGALDAMVLPPCHYGFQCYVREGKYLSLMWNQRSVDTFLGLPFNIASYGLLLEILAKTVNMVPDQLIGNLGDVHLYNNHIEQAKEQINRNSFELPKLKMNPIFLANLEHKGLDEAINGQVNFELENYQSHPSIKAPLSN
jgi:thymidylate synthase